MVHGTRVGARIMYIDAFSLLPSSFFMQCLIHLTSNTTLSLSSHPRVPSIVPSIAGVLLSIFCYLLSSHYLPIIPLSSHCPAVLPSSHCPPIALLSSCRSACPLEYSLSPLLLSHYNNIGSKVISSLSRISTWKSISYLTEEFNTTELSYRKCFAAN